MVARHVAVASTTCATLDKKRVSPHVLRHAAAMELLQAGVDRAVIALWLGHESVETTQIYLDADLALKEQVLGQDKTPQKQGRPLPTRRRLADVPQDAITKISRTMPHDDDPTSAARPTWLVRRYCLFPEEA